jgi:hypothetical protein
MSTPSVIHVQGTFAQRLHRIGVHLDATLARDLRDLHDRLDRADLVVGVHDRDQPRVIADGVRNLPRIDQRVLIHADHGQVVALFLQVLAGVQHRVMLDRGGDHVPAIFLAHGALDGEIVGL